MYVNLPPLEQWLHNLRNEPELNHVIDALRYNKQHYTSAEIVLYQDMRFWSYRAALRHGYVDAESIIYTLQKKLRQS